MTQAKILSAFNTPSQIKVDTLRKENAILERQIKRNNIKINSLIKAVESEGNVIANRLDKKFPKWRLVLVQAHKKIN